MTYGFSPENWPAFQGELSQRGIEFAEIEKVELRPDLGATGTETDRRRSVTVTVTLRSGRVETWSHSQRPGT